MGSPVSMPSSPRRPPLLARHRGSCQQLSPSRERIPENTGLWDDLSDYGLVLEFTRKWGAACSR